MHNCFYTAYGSIFDAQSEGGCARILRLASRAKTAPKSIFWWIWSFLTRSFVWFLLILLDPLWFWLVQGEYKRMRHSDCDNWTGKKCFLKKDFWKTFFSFFLDFSMFFENEFWRKKWKKCVLIDRLCNCPSTEFYNLPPGEALDTKV